MKAITYNIHEVSDSAIDYIPHTCAFCQKKPIGLLEIKKLFFSCRRWVCSECKHKWIKGELSI